MAMRTEQPIVTEQINVWNVTALEVLTPWQDAPRMVVTLNYGYDSGAGIQWLRDTRIEVPAEVLISSWSAVVSGVSIFEAVRASVYAWLQQTGAIPADAAWQMES